MKPYAWAVSGQEALFYEEQEARQAGEAFALYRGDERLSAAIYLLEALAEGAPSEVSVGDARFEAWWAAEGGWGNKRAAFGAYQRGVSDARAVVAQPETNAWADKVMEQAQVFASSWSLVGGRFDDGTQHEQALQEKGALRAMLAAALKGGAL